MNGRQPDILFADLERAALPPCDPQLAELLLQFLAQGDPPPGFPEQWDNDRPPTDPAADAWTLPRLRDALQPHRLRGKTADQRRTQRRAAWDALLASAHPPPRLRLGQLLLTVYQQGGPAGHAQLVEFFRRLPQNAAGWGVWQGFKQIYKLAEQRHDLAMLGVLCYRLDTQRKLGGEGAEIGRGTWLYMRRRAWRYLRQLGAQLPELYPSFAVQVLCHYPAKQRFDGCWIANQIWHHRSYVGRTDQGGGYRHAPPSADTLSERACADSWKLSPAPLLWLLEQARNDQVCDFAILCLEQDFKDSGVLRDADPAWLARVGARPLPALHGFVVRLLHASPEFHQSKLAELGLHDTVLGFLASGNGQARDYALSYARGYAQDMPVEQLLALIEGGNTARAVRDFALTLLDQRRPQRIGLDGLLRLLASPAGKELARAKLRAGFNPDDVDTERFVELALRSAAAVDAVEQFFRAAPGQPKVPAGHYCRLLDDPRCSLALQRKALRALDGYPDGTLDGEWIKRALLRPELSPAVLRWLRRGAVTPLDVEWLKGLVMRPALRPQVLQLLADPNLVKPEQLGVAWLLALVRNADETLHGFAERTLLTAFRPGDFATTELSGAERLWRLADGDQPQPLRRFAAEFLQRHHPTLNAYHDAGFSPELSHDDYAHQRLRPLFDSPQPDLRRLAVKLAGSELLRWDRPQLLFELAGSRHREPREFAIDQLLQLGQTGHPPLSWLLPEALFQLAENRHKPTRETALTLIRRHYRQVGGAERLAWLMDSPEREVGLFAVRLLWDKHRPSPLPPDWRGKAPPPDGRFNHPDQVTRFLRKTLFGLPPGRMERRQTGTGAAALPERPLPASVSKRRLIDTVKDFALTDADFAARLLPVLAEFRHSRAKGESQRCIVALAQLRRAHPQLAVPLPTPASPATPT